MMTIGGFRMKEKILLVLLPFWTPLIPPMGLACLQAFLKKHGYPVKAVDANTDEKLREYYDNYFDTLRTYVPKEKQGNFYSVGHDILRNHMMAHLDHKDNEKYVELVKILIYKSYYIHVDDSCAALLNRIIKTFYEQMEQWFIGWMEQEKPGILGISVYSGTLPVSMWAARLTRERFPAVRVVIGGGVFCDQLDIGSPNLEAFRQWVGDAVEKIIIGEGEILFHKYLRGELPASQKVVTLEDIGWEIMDLATAEPPDFSDLDLRAYPNLAAYTSRSCPYQCSFCSETVQWGKYRKKSAAQIVEELKQLYKRYRRQLYFLSDSLLNPVITELAQQFITSDISIYWDGCIRVDTQSCDPGKALLWRQGGFYRARLGMESASPNVLKSMNKKIIPQQMQMTLTSLARAGIKTSTLWLIGHPGETEEDFQQTLDFIETHKDYIYAAEGTPFWYHLTGQVKSGEWQGGKPVLLYPEEAGPMLVVQTWIMDCQPQREEIYRRLNRFTAHLERLEIPTPYSLRDIYQADTRWKKLHKNAVPSLMEFKNHDVYIDESKQVKERHFARSTMQHDEEWGF
jgi:hypothetical protein